MKSRSAAPFILRLAFRNLSRHRRRTGLTIGALAFGIALMVLGQAWTDAMQRAVLAVSVFAALLPSVSAARQSPAESLRYV